MPVGEASRHHRPIRASGDASEDLLILPKLILEWPIVADGDHPKTLIGKRFAQRAVSLGLPRGVMGRSVEKHANPFVALTVIEEVSLDG